MFYWVLSSCVSFYWVLPGFIRFTEFYWITPSFTSPREVFRCLSGHRRVLLGPMMFSLIGPGFIGLDRVGRVKMGFDQVSR